MPSAEAVVEEITPMPAGLPARLAVSQGSVHGVSMCLSEGLQARPGIARGRHGGLY